MIGTFQTPSSADHYCYGDQFTRHPLSLSLCSPPPLPASFHGLRLLLFPLQRQRVCPPPSSPTTARCILRDHRPPPRDPFPVREPSAPLQALPHRRVEPSRWDHLRRLLPFSARCSFPPSMPADQRWWGNRTRLGGRRWAAAATWFPRPHPPG